jgi:uncharacterized protein
MVTDEIKKYIDKSVLCWLATSNRQNEPNVSPKEMFTLYDDSTLLVANIASPNTIQNIETNSNVCVSFLDIFVQKGFKLKGVAKVIDKTDIDYDEKLKILTNLFTDKFPIKSIIEINIRKVDKIVAPSYYLYPETTEESQIESAMTTYKVRPKDKK